jgi:16S rRNA A1518/A1519 N6-dimethyltransferase RsmA/KsgA/DIM1 with predicted DNA glycosylase/AP lyase activity
MISIPGRDWASFLEDLNIIRRIVALAEPAGDETIVEIGAGLGFMTEELAKRADRAIPAVSS